MGTKQVKVRRMDETERSAWFLRKILGDF